MIKNKIESLEDLNKEIRLKKEHLNAIEVELKYDMIQVNEYLRPSNLLIRLFSSLFANKKDNQTLLRQGIALTINYVVDSYMLKNSPKYVKTLVNYFLDKVTYNIASSESESIWDSIKESFIFVK
ncbi:MAG: hypothetical protein Q8880_07465 [Bacteroidota bacterium]|nr:hypothetical protein [Bacteroidota bacterium]